VDIAYGMTEAKNFRTFIIACFPLKSKRLDASIQKSSINLDIKDSAGMQIISVVFLGLLSP
jgi:hypothetical protein